MTIFEKYQRVKALQKDLTKIGADAMYRTRDEFLNINREQMTEGYDSEGQRIGVYRWDSYERFKANLYPQSGGWMNFKLSGSFQEGMKLAVNSKTWKVKSSDGKEKKLLAIASRNGGEGRRIYGLAPDRFQQYRRDWFWPEFMFLVNRQLNG